jgi:hypothetical protein
MEDLLLVHPFHCYIEKQGFLQLDSQSVESSLVKNHRVLVLFPVLSSKRFGEFL